MTEPLSALVERVHQTQTPEDGWCFVSFGLAVAQAVAEKRGKQIIDMLVRKGLIKHRSKIAAAIRADKEARDG